MVQIPYTAVLESCLFTVISALCIIPVTAKCISNYWNTCMYLAFRKHTVDLRDGLSSFVFWIFTRFKWQCKHRESSSSSLVITCRLVDYFSDWLVKSMNSQARPVSIILFIRNMYHVSQFLSGSSLALFFLSHPNILTFEKQNKTKQKQHNCLSRHLGTNLVIIYKT